MSLRHQKNKVFHTMLTEQYLKSSKIMNKDLHECPLLMNTFKHLMYATHMTRISWRGYTENN